MLDRTLGDQLRRVDLAPTLGQLIEIVTRSGEADALFDSLLDVGTVWLKKNDVRIQELVESHQRW